MKPRLHVPWTEEDETIQWRNTVRHKRRGEFGFMGTRDSDRRDADIMRIGVMNPWCMITWEDQPGTEHVLLRWKPNRDEGRTLFPFIGYGQ